MENNNKSSLPIVIIGVVLLAAIGLGLWFYTRPKTVTPPGNVANTAKTVPTVPPNAPPGGRKPDLGIRSIFGSGHG